MPKPVADKPLNAYLYPEGGPGRQLKARLRAGEVLVGGMIAEYVRPSLVKCFQQLCKKHGIPFGTTASGPEAARRWVEQGALFFEAEDERNLILEGATRLVKAYRAFC